MNRAVFYHIISILAILSLLVISCEEDNLKPGIPVFIQVDSIGFTANYVEQGSSSHKITDVWVYADDQSIGAFEMPATIPVLKSGNGKLRLEAGIKLNGIASSRIPNIFYKPIIIEDFDFIKDSVVTVNMETTYWETVNFKWMEDFDGVSISIDTTSYSKANIEFTPTNSPLTFEGYHSGIVHLSDSASFFEGASHLAYELPGDGTAIFLELNYYTTTYLTVGIYAHSSVITKSPVIFLNPNEEWNKIYINLTPTVTDTPSAYEFKIYFEAALPAGAEESTIILDNIKLIHR
nr:hypothetical protein [Bacteroidota bacterium]